MTAGSRPLRFGHHALAVLAAAMLGATIFSLIWTTGLAFAVQGRSLELTWLATMAMIFWITVFIVALPGASVVFSLLFPVTRKGTVAAKIICILAGATTGVILAPLASSKLHGASLLQIATFALIGAFISTLYVLIGQRLKTSDLRPAATPPA